MLTLMNSNLSLSCTLEDCKDKSPGVAALGFFDGVHIGHQKLLAQTAEIAEQLNAVPMAFTFNVHPSHVIGSNAVKMLCSFADRVRLIQSFNVKCAAADFNREFASLSPEDFVKKIIVEKLHAAAVVVGDNYRFGAKAAGDTELLERLGRKFGFEVFTAERVKYGGDFVSSSRIRGLIESGNISEANCMLGRLCSWKGEIVHGRKVGRTLGIPTANIEMSSEYVHPCRGVFAAKCSLKPPSGTECSKKVSGFAGMAYWGNRPTFDMGREILEVTLITEPGYFEKDELYGWELTAEFCSLIRGEKKFSSSEEFVKQVESDRKRIVSCVERML